MAGVKLTGTAGRYTFATLAGARRVGGPGRAARCSAIGRGVRNFGDGQYVGVLVTDTEFRRDHNRVIAADFSLKHGERFRWNGNVILTDSRRHRRAIDVERRRRAGHRTRTTRRRVNVSGQVEHYDRGFRMDTAFINRVGVTRGWQYQGTQLLSRREALSRGSSA